LTLTDLKEEMMEGKREKGSEGCREGERKKE
jgi:hypothetical protein